MPRPKVTVKVTPTGVTTNTMFDELYTCLPKSQKKELLAEFIRDKMRRVNLKSNEFAEKINKRPSEITKWLSGSHNFTIDTIFEIEEKLGITIVNLREQAKEVNGESKCIKVVIPNVKLNLPIHDRLLNVKDEGQTFKSIIVKSPITNKEIMEKT